MKRAEGFDLQFLREITAVLDSQLRRLELGATTAGDPGSSINLDHAEHTIGLGFAVFQTYLSAVHGARPKECLDLGPRHRCGKSFSRICNEVANYWKHRAEWRGRRSAARPQLLEVFDALGLDIDAEYVANKALTAIVTPLPVALGTVVPFLVQWAESIQQEQVRSS